MGENFPARNRLIAGLSLGTIVVEAGFNSGALITAKFACEYEREVMAVPGKVDSPLSKGAHQLIKQGAKLIESVADVTDSLGYVGEQVKEQVVSAARRAEEKVGATLFDIGNLKLNDGERTIYDCLNTEPMHIDQIILIVSEGARGIVPLPESLVVYIQVVPVALPPVGHSSPIELYLRIT